jgi:hypothetical protein
MSSDGKCFLIISLPTRYSQKGNSKCKFVPVDVMHAYRQSERLIYSLSTSAVDGGEWLNLLPGCFVPRKETPVPIEFEPGWKPELPWTFLEKE